MKMPPPTGAYNKQENKKSILLSDEQNNQIFRLLGDRCQSISTSVVQLFVTDPPNHANWNKKDTGILCFIRDNVKKNYFFRLFCPRRNTVVWEHEMYNNMEYIESTPFLHTFEGQDYLIAFNFANLDEAKDMKKYVDIKINAKRKREEQRRQHHNGNQEKKLSYKPSNPQDVMYRKTPDLALMQAKRRRNITKADIGTPQDFKHVSHVGWSPTSGLDCGNVVDEHWKKFFEKAGVSETQLKDRETRDFIYNFINHHGGENALIDSIDNATEKANSNAAPPIPPVPPRGAVRTPNKPHVRAAPPPPPPSSRQPSRMPKEKPNPPTTYNNNVAPPPPPLPQNVPPQEVPERNGSSISPSLDGTAALLQSIRDGTTLRHVEDQKVAPVAEARNDLLCEIRKGFQLKPVQEREVKSLSQTSESSSNDLAGALARALAGRNMAMHPDDDEDDEDDSNDDEWD